MIERTPEERRANWASTISVDTALSKALFDHLEEEKLRHQTQDAASALAGLRLAGMELELTGISKIIGSVRGIKAAGAIIITLLSTIAGLFVWVLLDKNTNVSSEFSEIHIEIKEMQKSMIDLSIQNAKTLAAVDTLVKESAQIAAEVRDQLRDTTVVVTKAAKTVEKVQEKAAVDTKRQVIVDQKLEKLDREKQQKLSIPVKPPKPF